MLLLQHEPTTTDQYGQWMELKLGKQFQLQNLVQSSDTELVTFARLE